jgi:hypothetical protein
MEIRTIGIDLGKIVFHLVGVNARGKVVARKKCSQTQLLRFTSNVPNLCRYCKGLVAADRRHRCFDRDCKRLTMACNNAHCASS